MTRANPGSGEYYRSAHGASNACKRVAYVALNCRAIEEQVEFYTQMVGLAETARDEAGRVYLRCDAHHHAVVLVPSDAGGRLHHYGLDVGSTSELQAAAKALDAAGVAYEEPSQSLLGQGPCLELKDPEGMVVRLIAGGETQSPEYGVRAVQPRKLGHFLFLSSDPKRSEEWYGEGLGLRVSDRFMEDFIWMRCNPDHHGLAFVRAPLAGVQHFAFEVQNFSELARQADHLSRYGYRLAWGPGRHGPGHNLFIYFKDREGNVIEFTCDIQQIWDEENYVAKNWTPDERPDNAWGIGPTPEFMAGIGGPPPGAAG